MANAFVTPDWTVKETARRLVNNLVFASRRNCNRTYDSQYRVAGAAMGYTINARLPQRYKVSKGATLVETGLSDLTVPITITDQAHVGMSFSSASLTMEVDEYRERYIAPAVDALANDIDYSGLSRSYKEVAQTVGTPGTVPGSSGTLPQDANQVYLNGKVKLDDSAIPPSGRRAMLSSNMHAYLSNANVAVFNPTQAIASQYRTGEFGRMALGVDEWYMDQNVATHTVGALGGTPLVNGASQTGASITADGATASVTGYFLEGDVIQFASVNSVNPLSYASTGRLMDFVVTADVDSDGSGNLTIPISPSLTTSGVRQNATQAPANNDAITTFGHASNHAGVATPQGLVYHPDGVVLAMADLVKPDGVWLSERISNAKIGISLRIVKDYNIQSDAAPARVDTLYGWKVIREDHLCRVCS